jgi:hypothetical protein
VGVSVADPSLEKIGIGVLGVRSGFLDDQRRHDVTAKAFEVTAAHRHAGVTIAGDARRHVNNFGNTFALAVLIHGASPLLPFMPNNVLYST